MVSAFTSEFWPVLVPFFFSGRFCSFSAGTYRFWPVQTYNIETMRFSEGQFGNDLCLKGHVQCM
jgi:hypothetical protein